MSSLSIVEIHVVHWMSLLLSIVVISYSLLHYLKRNVSHSRLLKGVIYLSHAVLLIALLGFIFQPRIESTLSQTVDLYTSILDKNDQRQSNPAFYLSNLNPKGGSHNQIEPIFSVQQLRLNFPTLAEINVKGDGLDAWQWQMFSNIKINYQKPNLTRGFIQPKWRKHINLGEYLTVGGQVQINSNLVFTLQILDPAKDKVSEVRIRQGESFSLKVQPKTIGLHQYELVLLDNERNPLVREKIAVNVTEKRSLKLLVLQSAPSFETKQIQNWAAENGAEILVKSQISKDKWISRQTNSNLGKTDLSASLYQIFDLLLIDGRALVNLSEIQLRQIQESVEAGLGIVIFADQDLMKSDRVRSLLVNMELQALKEKQEVTPFWSDHNNGLIAPNERLIPSVAAKIIAKNRLLKTLVRAENGDVLVAASQLGSGQVAISLLRETHRWVTMNDKTSFSHYWQNLIWHIARRGSTSSLVNDPRAINFAYQSNRVCIESQQAVAQLQLSPQSIGQSQAQYIQMNVMPGNLNRYCGSFWPSQAGWYRVGIIDENNDQVMMTQGQANWLYFYPRDEWQSVQQASKVLATLNKQFNYRENTQKMNATYARPINLWIWWWLFLVSVTILWVERKFN